MLHSALVHILYINLTIAESGTNTSQNYQILQVKFMIRCHQMSQNMITRNTSLASDMCVRVCSAEGGK
jgi:hypothetical protein